jgi:hypothetical protein
LAAWNSQSSCLSLLSAGVTDIHHHAIYDDVNLLKRRIDFNTPSQISKLSYDSTVYWLLTPLIRKRFFYEAGIRGRGKIRDDKTCNLGINFKIEASVFL